MGPFLNESQHFLGPPLSVRAKHREKCCTGADGLWYLAPSCLLQTQVYRPPVRLSWPHSKQFLSASEKYVTLPSLFSASFLVSPQKTSPSFCNHTCTEKAFEPKFICQLETQSHCLPLQSIEKGGEGNSPTRSPH